MAAAASSKSRAEGLRGVDGRAIKTVRCEAIRHDAMRCVANDGQTGSRTSVDVDQGVAAGGGQRRG